MNNDTVGDWRARKQEQADRFMKLDPSLRLENWQDHRTRFELIHASGSMLLIGQLARTENGQELIDLSDDEIDPWAMHVRTLRPRENSTSDRDEPYSYHPELTEKDIKHMRPD